MDDNLKARGDKKRQYIHLEDRQSYCRSSYRYCKIDKARGLRRKADRHCHHRRRKINREELSKHGENAIPLSSTTCAQKRKSSYGSFPQPLSNRKGSAQSGHAFIWPARISKRKVTRGEKLLMELYKKMK